MGMVLEAVASYVEGMMRDISEVEVGMLPGVLREIESMGDRLRDLRNFLNDADRRSFTDVSVQAWVTELKHAMYGATDIIDLCQLEAMERGSSAANGMGCFNPLPCCMRNPIYARDIVSRIKGLNERLDNTMRRARSFSFLGSAAYARETLREFKTSSLFLQSGLVGEKIEEATESLVAKIIQTRKEVNNNIAVVAIVGVGGIGKTILAKKVFHDEEIQCAFERHIWMSINKDFNKVQLLRAAIVAAGGDLHPEMTSVMLLPILTAALTGRRVLLVMDDVWNHTAWEDVFEEPFVTAAAQGSRVLITTRDERVAQRMRAEHPYHRVDKLGPEDAWSLMKRQVITSEVDEPEIDMLKDIGLQIIAKCGGLPLAVKVMGGLLCQRERQRRDWEMVLNGYSPGYKIPEEINNTMYLSYEEMSPCLKQCFLHYSLLPTNVVFYENDIIGMWISEGFVHGNSRELEEIGRRYYDELILMNLIEMDGRYTSQRVCNMNDVVRSFAQFICRDETQVAHEGEMYGTKYLSSEKVYRLSLNSKGLESDMLIWSLLQKYTSLRTLVSIGPIKLKVGDSLIAFSTLRILHMESTNAAALVESLCQLKHLRYLSAINTDVSSLPENIDKIKLLQHINLDGCESLEKLPDSIIKLVQLRYLNLNDTSISVIAQGFCGLMNLRKLYGFPAHMDGDWCSLEELGSLSQLREIGLKGLDNIAATSFAAKARLGEKVHLTYLKLGCTTRLGDDGLVKEGRGVFQDEENQRIESVFDELHPPDCLQILDIQGYFGLQLPLWMRTTEVTLLKSLVVLTMEDLAFCTQLPYGLCQLPYLKVLKIKRAPAISVVGPEFVGFINHHTDTKTMFGRLHELVFFGMVEWEEWVWEKQVNAQAMPVLEELLLDTCKLRSFPPGLAFHARALKRLVITAAPNLNSLDSFASVVELDVYFSPNLRSIANLLKLQKLTIVICPKLGTLIGVPAIQKLVLEAYDMKTLPRYLEDVSNLSLLQLDCSLELLNSIALGESGPEWEKFSHVKHVEVYAHDGDNRRKWYVFYTKDPYKLETNTSLPSSKLAAVGKGEEKLIGKDEGYIFGTVRLSDSAVAAGKGEDMLIGKDDEYILGTVGSSDSADSTVPVGKGEDTLSGKDEEYILGTVGSTDSAGSTVAVGKGEDRLIGKDEEDILGTVGSSDSAGSTVVVGEGKDTLIGKDEEDILGTVGSSDSAGSTVAVGEGKDTLIGKDEERILGKVRVSDSAGSTVAVGKGKDTLIGNFGTVGSSDSAVVAVGKGENTLIGEDKEYILGTVGSSDSAVSEDDRELVGIDSPCEDLIKLLMHGDDKQLKMASICGTGGLGKTTIAHAVYRKIENEFSCKAFIHMPRGPDIKVNIGSICAEVGCPCPKFEECGVQQLIDRLKIFFEEKRYLIVFDDIWDTSVWDQILPALRTNNKRSRIIITTRKVSVAEHVGGLYHLPLLSYNDSKMLFFRRTLFGSEDHCPSQFRELSKKMLRRCGQLPLAIIVMTDLLPKGMVLDGWQKVCDSIEMGEGMKNIRRVLKHSYDDLPKHLQKCLLYLSIFPKGCKIRRDSLVQRWIVEELISGKDGQSLKELGESYLSELINSSMIEQIEFDSFGRDVAYHVPVTTLDLIVDLSIHENFVTILPSLQRVAQSSKLQRLSLQDSNEQHDVLKATKTVGQVSSLSLFHGADLMQPLSKFQGLHVLDLENCDSLKNEHLNGLGNLDKLRYLVLGSSHITEIPKKIGKLRHLQTLDLRGTGVKELPSSIVKLTKLQHLLINRSTEVPDKIIGKLQALEELVEINISKSPNILQEISTIPELKVLSIALWSWDECHTTLLFETLCKLTTKKLKHLSIFSCCLLDFKSDIQPVLQQLEKLEIHGSIFNKIPNWISSLTHLRSLSLEIYSLDRDALRILGNSTHLLFLSLVAKRAPGEKLVIGRGEFHTLRTFLLFNRAMAIKFEEGAMETLQRLKLTLQAALTKTDDLCFGLETLASLKHVQVEIICFSAKDGPVKVAEAAIQSMIGNNPSKPTLEITRTVEKYMTEDKKTEADREIKGEDEDHKVLFVKKSEECDPLQSPIDEVAVIMAGEGKKHGRYMLVDGYIEPPTSLSQIRAWTPSGSSGVQPARAIVTNLQLEEERRLRLKEREAFERRLEEERRLRLEGERQQAYMMEHFGAVYARVFGTEVPPMTPPPSRAPTTSVISLQTSQSPIITFPTHKDLYLLSLA
uniref:Uncharacterized protein n=1 Tax=Avena sativa TaxID=4498 RepID=A0ACD5WCG7_AVESA